jgi:hypothetical protein
VRVRFVLAIGVWSRRHRRVRCCGRMRRCSTCDRDQLLLALRVAAARDNTKVGDVSDFCSQWTTASLDRRMTFEPARRTSRSWPQMTDGEFDPATQQQLQCTLMSSPSDASHAAPQRATTIAAYVVERQQIRDPSPSAAASIGSLSDDCASHALRSCVRTFRTLLPLHSNVFTPRLWSLLPNSLPVMVRPGGTRTLPLITRR